MNIFNSIHKLFNRFNDYFGSGFLNSMPTDIWSRLYTWWLVLSGSRIGDGSLVYHGMTIRHPENIILGDRVMIPRSTDMAGMGTISIGSDSLVGASVRFITNHHPLDDATLSRKEILRGTQQTITVGRNCWIMNNVLIIAGKHGITIGDNVWIAAGAVVNHDVPSNKLVGGIPARIIKDLG